jgi:hypothetical protein
MPTTGLPTLASRGTMLQEVDCLELGPDAASAWDDARLVDGELTTLPGWEAWGSGPAPRWEATCSTRPRRPSWRRSPPQDPARRPHPEGGDAIQRQ